MSNVWYQEITRDNWKTLLASWLGWALDGLDFVLITYVLTDISKQFHISLTIASTLILATFATRWLGGAVVGSVLDRIGRKNAMILGVLIYSVATFLCGLSWSYWSLLVFRLFVGIGMAGEYAAGSTLLLENWPERVRNKASGFLVSGWAVGGLLASVVYSIIVPNFGWRALFFVGIVPALLTLFIRFGVSESEEWTKSRAEHDKPQGVSFFQLFTKKWFPIAFIMFLFMFASFGMNWPVLGLMPTYLKGIGYNPAGIGEIMFISNFGALLGYWFSGFLADRIGFRLASVLTLLASLVFLVLAFSTAHSSSLITMGIFMFFLEFTNLGISGLWPYYITQHFDVDVRSSGLGFTYNLGAIAGGLSPVWGSALKSSIGLGGAIASLTFFWTIILTLIIAFNVAGRVKNRKLQLTELSKSY
ncbi:MFS transporter [Alicyclobacillus tolerans]|uniref:MFS transporter n=1 Tax=Alicyclobacillus tolerans TaxID=90970 RepID=UPI001F0113B9|nr:MFS transporter [Alicyclobacillus tolerans]MCF8567330.1 MFS transporter [Alicyclobacillus tolerans]